MAVEEQTQEDIQAVEKLAQARDKLVGEIGKVIIGQSQVIEELQVCLLCNGHCLLVGVPGLAKTLMISTISQIFFMIYQICAHSFCNFSSQIGRAVVTNQNNINTSLCF